MLTTYTASIVINVSFKTIVLNIFFSLFVVNNVNMTAITLKQIPDETHRTIKRIQLDLEDEGVKKTLEELYIEMLTTGLKDYQKKRPTK